jgi:hypothetical protein
MSRLEAPKQQARVRLPSDECGHCLGAGPLSLSERHERDKL